MINSEKIIIILVLFFNLLALIKMEFYRKKNHL